MSRRPADDQRRRAEIATRRAAMARDAGLQRISTMTRWMIAAIIGLSGALALIAANAFHGRTISSGTSGSSSASQTTTPATTTPATTTPANGLQSPDQAPVQTPSAPVISSGGS